jgi:hypothetical protein
MWCGGKEGEGESDAEVDKSDHVYNNTRFAKTEWRRKKSASNKAFPHYAADDYEIRAGKGAERDGEKNAESSRGADDNETKDGYGEQRKNNGVDGDVPSWRYLRAQGQRRKNADGMKCLTLPSHSEHGRPLSRAKDQAWRDAQVN